MATAARKTAGAESGSARTAEAGNAMTAVRALRGVVAALKFVQRSRSPEEIVAGASRRPRFVRARRRHRRCAQRLLRKPGLKPDRRAMARLDAVSPPRRSAPTPRAAIARAHRHRRCAPRLLRKPDRTLDRKAMGRLVAASPLRQSAPAPRAAMSFAMVATAQR